MVPPPPLVGLISPGHALPDVYEFEGTFGMEKLISVSERAFKEYGDMEFIAAKEEYERTCELMELFGMSGVAEMRVRNGWPTIRQKLWDRPWRGCCGL
jgi:hypothetical protein